MKRIFLSLLLLIALSPLTSAQAGDGVLYIAADHLEGYDRSLFKLWIDADKNGCDTRKEVLIAEAIVKPKKGKNCVLTGGKWISSYDGKSYTKDSDLDIDHLVPLAEAWRSGAWAWTNKERENYANFLEQEWMLNAVTASVNRSKGDKDIANWLPTKNVCEYLRGWVIVKAYFNLTVDAAEAKVIDKNYNTCGLGWRTKQSSTPTPTPSTSNSASGVQNWVSPKFEYEFVGSVLKIIIFGEKTDTLVAQGTTWWGVSGSFITIPREPPNTSHTPRPVFDASGKAFEKITWESKICNTAPERYFQVVYNNKNGGFQESERQAIPNEVPFCTNEELEFNQKSSPSPSSTAKVDSPVSPGAFCSPGGATGKSENGTSYTCKTSPTDTRNRWRQ